MLPCWSKPEKCETFKIKGTDTLLASPFRHILFLFLNLFFSLHYLSVFAAVYVGTDMSTKTLGLRCCSHWEETEKLITGRAFSFKFLLFFFFQRIKSNQCFRIRQCLHLRIQLTCVETVSTEWRFLRSQSIYCFGSGSSLMRYCWVSVKPLCFFFFFSLNSVWSSAAWLRALFGPPRLSKYVCASCIVNQSLLLWNAAWISHWGSQRETAALHPHRTKSG